MHFAYISAYSRLIKDTKFSTNFILGTAVYSTIQVLDSFLHTNVVLVPEKNIHRLKKY